MRLKHFAHLDHERSSQLFSRAPSEWQPACGSLQLTMMLGGTLYLPACRADLSRDIERARAGGLTSLVLDLEDSVGSAAVGEATRNVYSALAELHDRCSDGSVDVAVFVRVRSSADVGQVLDRLGDHAAVLTGLVIPKFRAEDTAVVGEVARAGREVGRTLYCMPVLETIDIVRRDGRVRELVRIRESLAEVRSNVLAIRVGITDIAAVLGLRRPAELAIHDVQALAAVLVDIVNVMRTGAEPFEVVGPVWEHFAPRERVLRPQLRSTPFVRHQHEGTRQRLMSQSYDGLIREVLLDRANGLIGKTAIHPDQAKIVNAMSVVSHEDWCDASEILSDPHGGARAASMGHRMNEPRPHLPWAKRTVRRAHAFGVARPDVSFSDVLAAEVDW